MKNTEINNPELAVLGLVNEAPAHGYQLEQRVIERGMRNWTDLAFSSIYSILTKLEKRGLLQGGLQTTSEGPARKVYTVTPAGGLALRAAVLRRIEHAAPRSADVDLALAYLPCLSKDEAQAAFERYRTGLTERRAGVSAKWAADRAAAAPAPLEAHVDALFARSLALIEADLAWVERFLAG